MQINWPRVLALSALLTRGVTSVTWAHTTVSPEQVPAGSIETFTERVPQARRIFP